MDISSASDQPSSVRRRPLSLKAAPSTSLEAESDNNAVLLRREISRKFAAHLPAPRRERKKSVSIIPFPAANVVSSSIIFLLLFLHFLASVSDASRLSSGWLGKEEEWGTASPNRSLSTSPGRNSSSPVSRTVTSKFKNGEPVVYSLGGKILLSFSRVEGIPTSWRIINPGQKRKRVSLYVGQAGEIGRIGASESGLAARLRRALQDSIQALIKNRQNKIDGFDKFVGRATQIPNNIDRLIRIGLGMRFTGRPTEIPIKKYTDDFKHKVIFASVVHSYKWEGRIKIKTGAAAVLIIWDPLALPYFDRQNVGMVYVAPPDAAHLPDPESKKRAIRDSAKIVSTLLAHYRRTKPQYDGEYKPQGENDERWLDLVKEGPFPSIQEYHAELIGEQFGLNKREIVKENLLGYLEGSKNAKPQPFSMVTNLDYADKDFVKKAFSSGDNKLEKIGYQSEKGFVVIEDASQNVKGTQLYTSRGSFSTTQG